MNIFILDYTPEDSASQLCDKHVVKMLLETAQLLCGPFEPGTAPYGRTHYNHPCAKWIRASARNYEYLLRYGNELCTEFYRRYGKTHKSAKVISWCMSNYHRLDLPITTTMTPHVQALPDKYKHHDPVVAYRAYYICEKGKFATWKNRRKPEWWGLPWTIYKICGDQHE